MSSTDTLTPVPSQRPDADASSTAKPSGLADRVAGRSLVSVLLLLLVLAGLPLAVWMDLRALSDRALRDQANSFTAMIDSVRGYYSTNIVGRILGHEGRTLVLPNYASVPGAIPIPATLSLELSSVISQANTSLSFRFFSDLPFATRTPHAFDDFERSALASLRADPDTPVFDVSGSLFDRSVRLATPIIMGAACVSCHNSHPDSPKQDWKIGDVRGLEEITIHQPIAANIFAFRYLLGYFALVAAIGGIFIAFQRHQSVAIAAMNRELGRSNQFLVTVSQKLAKYLSPQHYRSIFSGEKDVVISTERKKLTIFFSDIVGFTSTAERLQPEELTALLNEYLTEMSAIAARHGGTVNKFIGDAILIFFGDPESKGVREDAIACLRMSFEMQERVAELNLRWRKRGVEEPFKIRIGINTGYCNVGNFGSDDRMDYTIIGAEANLAARLQSIAEPGGVVVSYETFVHVAAEVRSQELDPIVLKGISHPVVPFKVEPAHQASEQVFSVREDGLDFFLDLRQIPAGSTARIRETLQQALIAMKENEG